MAHYTIRTTQQGITVYWNGIEWDDNPIDTREYPTVAKANHEARRLSAAGCGICTVYGYPDGRYINGDYELLRYVPGRGYVAQ